MNKNTKSTEIKTRTYRGETYYYLADANGKPLSKNLLGWKTRRTAILKAKQYDADVADGYIRPGRFS